MSMDTSKDAIGSPSADEPAAPPPDPTRVQHNVLADLADADGGRERKRTPIRRVSLFERYGLLGIWAIVIGFFWLDKGGLFMQTATFKNIFGSQEPLIFLSMALVITFAVGEFDLSVASVLGTSGTLVAVLYVQHGYNIWLAVLVSMAAAVGVGLVNAILIVLVGVEAIIVTLGMSTLLLGLASSFTNGAAISGLPTGFSEIGTQDLWGLQLSFYYGIGLALILAYVMAFTPLGRHMLFVGENREVARLAGVRVQRIRFCSYVVTAFISGLGGILLAMIIGGFDPQGSTTYLLPAFAAVFLGTVVIVPARFNAIGTVVAVYFLVTGIVGLQILGVDSWVSNVFFGGALIVAVTLSQLAKTTVLGRARRRKSTPESTDLAAGATGD
jgi:ribose transport system permease protein